jgi:hypothetical protein
MVSNMSIRGIDTQIMITRATDFVRETSSMQRQPELSQEHLAQQTKIESVQDQSRVIATTESEMENIRTDEEGEGSGAAGGGGKRHEEQEPEEEEVAPELRIAPAPHDCIIDIMI